MTWNTISSKGLMIIKKKENNLTLYLKEEKKNRGQNDNRNNQ